MNKLLDVYRSGEVMLIQKIQSELDDPFLYEVILI